MTTATLPALYRASQEGDPVAWCALLDYLREHGQEELAFQLPVLPEPYRSRWRMVGTSGEYVWWERRTTRPGDPHHLPPELYLGDPHHLPPELYHSLQGHHAHEPEGRYYPSREAALEALGAALERVCGQLD